MDGLKRSRQAGNAFVAKVRSDGIERRNPGLDEEHTNSMKVSMSRARVTITLSRELLEKVDRTVRKRPRASRSSVVEQWLTAGARVEAERDLDRAITEYYEGMSEADRTEEADWSRFSTASFMVREQRREYAPKRPKKKSGA